MNRILSQNQFACRSHVSLKEVPTMGGSVRASYYQVRMHLRLSVLERGVANERKQFHLFVENAGWIVLFRLPIEPTQFRVRESADGFKATTAQTLVLRELLQEACDLVAGLKDQGKNLRFILDLFPPHVISFPKTVSGLQKTTKERRCGYFKAGS